MATAKKPEPVPGWAMAQLLGFDPVPVTRPTKPAFGERGDPVVGEVRAWRAWKLIDGCRLFSLFAKREWFPGEPMDADVDVWVGQPRTIRGGIYAYNDETRAAAEFQALHLHRSEFGKETLVNGAVDLHGEVVFHNYGYRAQFATVAGLTCIADRRRDPNVPSLHPVWKQQITFDGLSLTALRERYKLTE